MTLIRGGGGAAAGSFAETQECDGLGRGWEQSGAERGVGPAESGERPVGLADGSTQCRWELGGKHSPQVLGPCARRGEGGRRGLPSACGAWSLLAPYCSLQRVIFSPLFPKFVEMLIDRKP